MRRWAKRMCRVALWGAWMAWSGIWIFAMGLALVVGAPLWAFASKIKINGQEM